MRTQLTSKLTRGAAAALAVRNRDGRVSSASAQTYRTPTGGGLGSVVSCDAPGGKPSRRRDRRPAGRGAGLQSRKHDRRTGRPSARGPARPRAPM